MTETITTQHDVLTAQKIAKLLGLNGKDTGDAGDRFSTRYIQQYAGYLPGFRPTLEWMLAERLIVSEGTGRAGEGMKTLALTDLGKAFFNQFGTDTRQMKEALALPPFVYELGPKAFMGFGLWCLEKGMDPKQVLKEFLDAKTSSFQF